VLFPSLDDIRKYKRNETLHGFRLVIICCSDFDFSCYSDFNRLVFLYCITVCIFSVTYCWKLSVDVDMWGGTVHSPPVIAPDLDHQMSFRERERVELPCVATGDPLPS